MIETAPPEELRRIDQDWPLWARPSQRPPEGDWRTWLFLGGRGAGKTRAGAEWLRRQATPGARLALVGPTLHDVREVMIEGESGLRRIGPVADRPVYEPSRRRLVWRNGAVGHAFTAEDPEGLRGPQFHAAWVDEFGAWARPGETLAMLRLGLRLGQAPRLMVSTTPKPGAALRRLMAEPGCVTSRSGTVDNAEFLAPDFVQGLTALYGGTRLAAQELDGLVLDELGGLWTPAMIQAARGPSPDRCERVVVGLDPPATAGGDACGIVVVGRNGDRAHVLADRTVTGATPLEWGRATSRAAADFGADRVVAEVNQGGDMVTTILTMAGCAAPVRSVRASTGKLARAGPVAALYEQGRVTHCGSFPELEEELLAAGGEGVRRSPDRMDALVWAVSDLMLERRGIPRIRGL